MNVILGVPSYSGEVTVWFCDSLVNTIRVCPEDIKLFPVFLSYDALIQRARNDLVAMAIEHDLDALVFIDSDMQWNPTDLFKLLAYEEDVVGGTVRKKSDTEELYNVNTQNLKIEDNGLIKVNSVGTGFLKLSKKALQALWDNSEEYTNENKSCRMIFDVKVIDGELISEDNVMCRKLRELGFDVWIDPTVDCPHLGVHKYTGNFMKYREEILKPKLKVVRSMV